MATLKRQNALGEWEVVQVVGGDFKLLSDKVEDIQNRVFIVQDTEPLGIEEGRVWIDTNDNTFYGIDYDEIKNMVSNYVNKDGSKSFNYITIGVRNGTVGANSFAQGLNVTASGLQSHAEGYQTNSTNSYSHAEGQSTMASGQSSHAEGISTKASGVGSHAEGRNTTASGLRSHAEGYFTEASGNDSHAEGYGTIANGETSHAEGNYTTASGENSHAEGYGTIANGETSHAEGEGSIASGVGSHAEGYYTESKNYASHAQGQYSNMTLKNATTFDSTADAFVIGNGTSKIFPSNAFRVTFNGSIYGKSAFNSTGADYAEYFEWLDGNVEGEDRVGYFVTIDGKKIRKANSTDDYILGIISANPSVIGDSHQEEWYDKYVRDDWGRIQYHYVDVEYEEEIIIENEIIKEDVNILIEADDLSENKQTTEIIKVIKQEYQPKLNPNWLNNEEYIPREQRKEWSAVGMMGKLFVRDDGTCQVNGYCKPNDEGIATASNEGYRVMDRIKDNIIQVLVI